MTLLEHHPISPDGTAAARTVFRRLSVRLLVLYVFLLPFENALVIPGFGTLARLVGLTMFAAWFYELSITGSFRKPLQFHGLLAALVAWSLGTTLWAERPFTSLLFEFQFIQLLLFMIAFWDLVRTPDAVRAMLRAYIYGSLVLASWITFNGLSGNFTDADQRASIPNSNENYIGLVLVIAMPIALHLARTGRRTDNPLSRLIFLGFIPLALVGIFYTGSRGSLVSSAPFFVYAALTSIRRDALSIPRIAIGAGAVFASVVYLAPQSGWSRFSTIGSSVEQGDFGSRQYFWRLGYLELTDDLPRFLFGHGIGMFDFLIGGDAHQTFLEIGVEIGAIGLILYLGVVAAVGLYVFKTPRAERALWITVFSSWMLGVQTRTWQLHKVTWLVFALIVGAAATTRALRRPPDRDPADHRT